MGKNSIAQIALGRTAEEEYKDNLRHISTRLEGNTGLLFTSRDKAEVEKYFKSYSVADFAKAGAIAEEDFVLAPGKLEFPVQMLDELRGLGMVVEVASGTVVLRTPVTVTTKGQAITPEQAKMLVKLGRKIINFKVTVSCAWEDGSYVEF
jgi:mRNA turnover protein 4